MLKGKWNGRGGAHFSGGLHQPAEDASSQKMFLSSLRCAPLFSKGTGLKGDSPILLGQNWDSPQHCTDVLHIVANGGPAGKRRREALRYRAEHEISED